MATGKELVRLTECNYWKRLIAPDVDSFCFYDVGGNEICLQECRLNTFCRIRIELKHKKFTKKYVKLLAEFCRLIASTNSETMFVRVTKKKYYIIDIN
jgi:hypothetical protein